MVKKVKDTGEMARVTDNRSASLAYEGIMATLNVLDNGDIQFKINNKLVCSRNINEFK